MMGQFLGISQTHLTLTTPPIRQALGFCFLFTVAVGDFFFFSVVDPCILYAMPGTESELQLRPRMQQDNTGSFNPLPHRDQTYTSTATGATTVEFLTQCATAGTPREVLFLFHFFK